MKRFDHGGAVFAAARALGMDPSQVLDLSASINPLGVPAAADRAMRRHLRDLVHYPDSASAELTAALADYCGIDPAALIVGNGSTELIYLAMRGVQPASALIPAPTFSEYERAAMTGGTCRITYFPLREPGGFRLDPEKYIAAMTRMVASERTSAAHRALRSAAFLCNPNNPTGVLTPREDVLRIARAARQLRCYLIVDEAFIDFCPEHSIVDAVRNNPFVIVLRSMTKFYALAGARLGFGVFPPAVKKTISALREPWSVNRLAQVAGVAALSDDRYRRKTFRLIEEEKRFLEQEFTAMDIRHVPFAANYCLFTVRNGSAVQESLFRKGILVRSCANFRGLTRNHMRIAVRSHAENKRFLEELKTCRV